MNSIIKKTLPITLLLLSGCAHHYGLHSVRPHYRGSYDISIGSHFYKDHHHYKPRGYRHNWWPFYKRRHHYKSDHKYRGDKYHGRRYKNRRQYFKHKKYYPKYYEYEDRC